MYVIVTGNIAGGFRIVGPFKDYHDADEYRSQIEDYGSDELTIMEVEAVE